MQPDKTDMRIMEILQEEGRLSNAKLAEQLSLSETPCWRRLRQLEQEGYIEGYQANVNRRKLGLGVLAFVQISFAQHIAVNAEFEQTIMQCPNILTCHNTTGDADFLLQVVAKNLDDYSRFLEEVLRKIPGVTSIHSNLSLREIKSSNRLPVD
ncbi:Lrp/AsnC family transcriptional regulator [Aliamphritea ceti]|uniref:Lrp/AsnC family transcriptional regulator n=1 Tax=Aliamphritea ceti TaxID=1524258 RepID=UPI0021C2B46C|nr:Lrp/AsnC family transcriptional regulator [Aliamphritea ceti]